MLDHHLGQELAQAIDGGFERVPGVVAVGFGPERIGNSAFGDLVGAKRDQRFQEFDGLARRLAAERQGAAVDFNVKSAEGSHADLPRPSCGGAVGRRERVAGNDLACVFGLDAAPERECAQLGELGMGHHGA